MSRDGWLVAFCLLVLGISLIGGCLSMATPDELVQAPDALSADYKLVDVTSSAGGSGKHLYSAASESYWENGEFMVRCFHKNVSTVFDSNKAITLGGGNCEKIPRPGKVPMNATLLAINKGTYQKTQSVWKSNGRLLICNHGKDMWGNVSDVESCVNWVAPSRLDGYTLASVNSGQYQETESFWITTDGTKMVKCRHTRDGVGFLGLEGNGLGAAEECNIFGVAIDLFPRTGTNYVLVGATSDSRRPAESFFQSTEGYLVQCQHEKVARDVGFLDTRYGFGKAVKCGYWRAPVIR